jgi:ferredoxin
MNDFSINKNKCIKCFGCVSVCPMQALEYSNDGPKWLKEKCNKCKICVKFCPVKAISFEG